MKILKAKYLSGVELLRNSSGFGWDPNTKRFTASNDVWADYVKAHPSYQKFRDETFEEFDDLKVIFENNIATGGNAIELGESTDAGTSEIAEKELPNYVEDFHINEEKDRDTPSPSLPASLKSSVEKLPLRKRHRGNSANNKDESILNVEEISTETNSLTTITQNLFNLIQQREARQQREAEQRETEKKKNNLWEAIKEVLDLEENIRYDAVKVIHQLGMKDVFVSMSIDECHGWIKRNVMG